MDSQFWKIEQQNNEKLENKKGKLQVNSETGLNFTNNPQKRGYYDETAKISVENENLKRKIKELQDQFDLNIQKVREENEENVKVLLKDCIEEIQELRSFKEEAQRRFAQQNEMAAQMEILRLKYFELENILQNKCERLESVENEYLKVKVGIGEMMTAFLEYGDPQVIQIMEYYLT